MLKGINKFLNNTVSTHMLVSDFEKILTIKKNGKKYIFLYFRKTL